MKLLKFYADWCKPCKTQSDLLKDFTDCEVDSINVEDDDKQELVDKYGIQALPTLLLVDEESNVKERFTGLTTVDKIREKLC